MELLFRTSTGTRENVGLKREVTVKKWPINEVSISIASMKLSFGNIAVRKNAREWFTFFSMYFSQMFSPMIFQKLEREAFSMISLSGDRARR